MKIKDKLRNKNKLKSKKNRIFINYYFIINQKQIIEENKKKKIKRKNKYF